MPLFPRGSRLELVEEQTEGDQHSGSPGKWPLNWRTGVGGCDPTLGKSWDEIIPEGERQKIDEDELHQQLVALNPPPRSRKTINKSAVSAAALVTSM